MEGMMEGMRKPKKEGPAGGFKYGGKIFSMFLFFGGGKGERGIKLDSCKNDQKCVFFGGKVLRGRFPL